MSLLGKEHPIIREIYEYKRKRSQEIGCNNIFDFSTSSPIIGAGDFVRRAILNILENPYVYSKGDFSHPAGDYEAREEIAEYINARYNSSLTSDNLYMTSGSLAALCICIKAIVQPGDEIITFSPCAPEYSRLIREAGAKPVLMNTKEDTFQIDFPRLWEAVTNKTRAVIINSPCNPTGVVFPKEAIISLCRILEAMSKQHKHPIYIISDDTYRDFIFDDVRVPYIPNYYANTFVCYSYGTAFSLPGECIGYALVSENMENYKQVYEAVCSAAMSIGQVCVSSLMQQLAARWKEGTADTFFYRRNRDMLYDGLIQIGYKCVRPMGTCYLFMKSLEEDTQSFCERARKYEILMVPGGIFGCPGYVRLAYSVDTEIIRSSLKAFERLAREYGL